MSSSVGTVSVCMCVCAHVCACVLRVGRPPHITFFFFLVIVFMSTKETLCNLKCLHEDDKDPLCKTFSWRLFETSRESSEHRWASSSSSLMARQRRLGLGGLLSSPTGSGHAPKVMEVPCRSFSPGEIGGWLHCLISSGEVSQPPDKGHVQRKYP